MLKIWDPTNFRRTLGGLCLILAPIFFAIAEITYPASDGNGAAHAPNDTWDQNVSYEAKAEPRNGTLHYEAAFHFRLLVPWARANIVRAEGALFEVALSGFDAEVGVVLPFLERFDARAFVGFYHFDHEIGGDANGIRGRLELTMNDRVTVHFSAQNEDARRRPA